MNRQKTFITAHSGADGTCDNSMEFVQYALTTSADVLELDVRQDKDHNLIIAHDETDGEAVSLVGVFSAMKDHPEMRMNCDLKEYGLELPVLKLAGECGLPVEQILYSGSVRPVPAEEPCPWRTVEVYWNVEECIPGIYEHALTGDTPSAISRKEAEQLAAACRKCGIRTVNICEKFLGEEFLSVMEKNGIGISAWTVNEPDRIRQLLDLGIRNITTRNLKEALRLRGEGA